MKKWMKWLLAAACAILLIAGAAWVSLQDNRAAYDTGNGMVYARTTSTSGASMKNSAYVTEESMDYGVAADTLMSSATHAAGPAVMMDETPRKLVRTADLTLRTTQFDQAVQQLQTMLADVGGYVENLYQYGETTRRISLSLRVPADKLDGFLSGLEGVGRLTDRSESTTDMTVQYTDNQARLNTLYQKRERLNVLLSQAENVSDLIEIEAAIADTQYEIDSYESRQRSIDRQVDMSAVNVTLIEDRPADSAQADISLWQRMQAGFKASVEWLWEFAQDLAVFIVMILPVAVPLGVIAVVIVVLRRRRKKG